MTRAALASVTQGLRGHWNCLFHTVPFSDYHSAALDAAIEMKLLPHLTRRTNPGLDRLPPLANPIERNRFTVCDCEVRNLLGH